MWSMQVIYSPTSYQVLGPCIASTCALKGKKWHEMRHPFQSTEWLRNHGKDIMTRMELAQGLSNGRLLYQLRSNF
jgi:hypothetical protein